MQSSTGDGDPAAVYVQPLFILFIILLTACHKPGSSAKKATVDSSKAVAIQQAAPTPKKKSAKKKKLYITFDDGPNKGTRNVLHIVKDEQVPVSFFVVGEHVFASTAQQQAWDSLKMAEHITLCNHSYSHASQRYQKYYQSPDSVVADFKRTQDSLSLDNRIARTPGRNIWRVDSLHFTDIASSRAAADSLAKAGFVLMGWDLEWHYDHTTMRVKQTADELVNQIDSAFAKNKTKIPDHLVLLAHDQVYDKRDDSIQLRQLLQKLKLKDEYEMILVTQYPGALRKAKGDSSQPRP